jgi:hypothetical protein
MDRAQDTAVWGRTAAARQKAAAAAKEFQKTIEALDAALPSLQSAARTAANARDATKTRFDSSLANVRAVDAAIGRLHRKLVADLAAYGDEEPEDQLARRLLEAAFPIGLSGHVKAPFAEQRTHNAVLAALLRSEAWAADIEAARLGPILRPMLAAIDHFELRYAAARREAGELSWADLRAAVVEAHEGLCVLVSHALVASEGDPALTQRVLRPILEEQAAIRRRFVRGGGEAEGVELDAEDDVG